MRTHPPDRLRQIAADVFKAAGASDSNAQRVANALVDANLAGHDSHGVMHIPRYVEAIDNGAIVPDTNPAIVNETPTTALVSGGWTFGQVGAEFATRIGIEKARNSGIAMIALIEATHIGRLGEYSEIAIAEGMAAIVAAGGFFAEGGQVAPFGGAKRAIGTNPISIGFPGGDTDGMMLDFATSAIAGGKVRLAVSKGTQLPEGVLIDKDGNPTTDPNTWDAGGALLPAAGHKGYALALAIEFLGGVITSAREQDSGGLGGPGFSTSGSLFIVMDTTAFSSGETYRAGADRVVRKMKSVPPAPGFAEVLTPGEPERRSKEERLRDGIPVPDTTWADICQTARDLGLPDPDA